MALPQANHRGEIHRGNGKTREIDMIIALKYHKDEEIPCSKFRIE